MNHKDDLISDHPVLYKLYSYNTIISGMFDFSYAEMNGCYLVSA